MTTSTFSATKASALAVVTLSLAACQSNLPAPVVDARPSNAASSPAMPSKPLVWVDRALTGTWVIESGDLGGKPFAVPGFTLNIQGDAYTAGGVPPNDRGTLKYHHQQAADGFPGLDVIGVEGPNAGRTIPAIYRMRDGKLEICYDLSGRTRPTSFEVPAGSQVLRVTYRKQ